MSDSENKSLTYPWTRYWYERGRLINADTSGYLLDPSNKYGFAYNPDLIELKNLRETPCLILLGEPGMGKSHTTEAEFDALKAETEITGDACLWLDLGQYDFGMWLENQLSNDPLFVEWVQGSHRLHLFLDAFDECLLRLNVLVPVLIKQLRKQEIQRLNLRIICRSGYWQSGLERELQDLWKSNPNNSSVQVYELAPILERDVRVAAVVEGLDADAFLTQIREREVVAFAIRPVTLKFLINIFRKGGVLPPTRAEIYSQGCTLLCEEHRPNTPSIRIQKGINTPQLVAVAERIAAITMFCKPDALWLDIDQGDVPEHDLTVAQLCGGKEVAEGNEFEVTEMLVRETLATGLFVSHGSKRMVWAQQTYAEYLAAQYLLSHSVSTKQILNLITYPDDPEHKLIPQLHEVGAWLAGASPEVFRAIREHDPLVLLRSDVARADVEDRAKLVAIMLQLYDDEKLLEYDFALRQQYARLKHPGLAEQLRPYLQDTSKGDIVRRVAVDVAETCHVHEVMDDIVQIALDPEQGHYVRINAALAVYRIGDAESKQQLKPLIYGGEDDPDEELKGLALRSLWPDGLSAEELFAVLTIPKSDNSSVYHGFLYDNPARNLRPEDVPIALRWLSQFQYSYLPFNIRPFASEIIQSAWEHLDVPHVLPLLAKLIVERLSTHDSIVESKHLQSFAQSVFDNDDKRRKLVVAMLPIIPNEKSSVLLFIFSRPSFLFPKDTEWLLSLLYSETHETIQRMLIWLIIRNFRWEQYAFDAIFEASNDLPALREAFEPYRVTELSSDAAEDARSEYQRRMQDDEEEAVPLVHPPPAERIAMCLQQFEEGDLAAWWQLNREMTLEPDSRGYGSEFDSDLTKLPGWESSNDTTRARMLNAAYKYVCEAKANTAYWFGKNIMHRPALAGYRALRLLLQETPKKIAELPEEIWREWMPILLNYPTQSDRAEMQSKRELLLIAYPHARDESIQTLTALIDKENQQHGLVYSLDDLLPCWDDVLSAALFAKLRDPQLKPEVMGRLLGILIQRNTPGATEFATSLLSVIPIEGEERVRAITAGRVLIEHSTDAGWGVIWPIIQNDIEFGRELLLSVAYAHGIGGHDFGQRISDEQLADLFLWLVEQFSYDDDPNHTGVYTPQPNDNIRMWRNMLPQALVESGRWTACLALRRMADARPDLPWLKRYIPRAEAVYRRKNWSPLKSSELLMLVRDSNARVIESGEQLLNAIIESLDRLEAKLQGDTPRAPFLWDRVEQFCRPKDENSLSDFVKAHLQDDLTRLGVIVNREVEVRRVKPNGIGERTDILVNASIPNKWVETRDTVSVVIEVKGCWHNELDHAMRTQLYDRYMAGTENDFGLYLVGWYNCPQWDAKDGRLKKAKSRSRESTVQKCEAIEEEIARTNKTVRHYILDVTLPQEKP
jgi:predicted NACHT family NTPase